MDGEIRIEPVESGVAGFFREADGAGEKPAVGRAFAVVEAVVGLVRLGIGDGGELRRFPRRETGIRDRRR